eukprot:5610438-Pyramimonas_sp.AAC.1
MNAAVAAAVQGPARGSGFGALLMAPHRCRLLALSLVALGAGARLRVVGCLALAERRVKPDRGGALHLRIKQLVGPVTPPSHGNARAGAAVGSAGSPRGAVSPLASARGRRGTWSARAPA